MSPNKYSFEIAINKKWPKNQSDLKEDNYESPTLIHCREPYPTVPLMRICLQTPLRVQGSWNDNAAIMLEVVVESSKEVDIKPSPSNEGSPQYYHRRGH
jgi:hypothetical protein